jgi:hypothetical protein
MLPGLDARPLRKESARLIQRAVNPFMGAFLLSRTAAAARTAIGAGTGDAQAGANSNINSLSGLTSPVAEIRQIQPISATAAANALTISASALALEFRSATLGSGAVSFVKGTPANLVVPATATLGTVNGIASRLVVLAINNAGTIELAVVNIAGGVNLDETGIINTTAIAGGSNSASTVYSTTARTGVPYQVLGIIDSTQATAGTWATQPSLVRGAGGQAGSAMLSAKPPVNVTGSRTLGVTNYNATGKRRTVVASFSSAFTGGSASVQATVAGVNFAPMAVNESNGASYQGLTNVMTFPVPAGMSYGISVSAGSATITNWTEFDE